MSEQIAAAKFKARAGGANNPSATPSAGAGGASGATRRRARGANEVHVDPSADAAAHTPAATAAAFSSSKPLSAARSLRSVKHKTTPLPLSAAAASAAAPSPAASLSSRASEVWPSLHALELIDDLRSLARLPAQFSATPASSATGAAASTPLFAASPSPLLDGWMARGAALQQARQPLLTQSAMLQQLDTEIDQLQREAEQYLARAQQQQRHAAEADDANPAHADQPVLT